MASAECFAVCRQQGLVPDGARPCSKAGMERDEKMLAALKTESITQGDR